MLADAGFAMSDHLWLRIHSLSRESAIDRQDQYRWCPLQESNHLINDCFYLTKMNISHKYQQ